MTETDLHPELRPVLFSIAYRMTGSVSEAEDDSERTRGVPCSDT